MKKIPILLIALMVISVGFLSGCNEENNSLTDEESIFVGTWKGDGLWDIIAFFSDRTCSHYLDLSGTWEIKDGKLVITEKDGLFKYDYLFTNDDNTLTLTNVVSGNPKEFIRQ